ncbi:MAG: GNAT family N-acetyltransferase [Xanthomarina sp.]
MKHILAFAGSNSRDSINKQLVTYASHLIENIEVSILDLNDFDLPIFSKHYEEEHGIPENALKFLSYIKKSDGVIVSLAENNGAYSAVFKNLFDWMSRAEAKLFFQKPMLLMATSTGARGGESVLAMAKDRFPRHNAQIVADFCFPFFDKNFSEGKIIDPEFDKELKEKVKQFKKQMDMDIKHEDNGESGKFFIEIDNKQEAEMTYEYIDQYTINIDHTEVKEALKGQGIGSKLIEAAVKFMRKNNLKAVATCSYAITILEKKKEEYKDVIQN